MLEPLTMAQLAKIPASPALFGLLVALGTLCLLAALRPSRTKAAVSKRLADYVEVEALEPERSQPFTRRALLPAVRKLLGLLGRFAPERVLISTHELLVQAGEPAGLGVLDFYGLRVLMAVGLGGLAFWALLGRQPLMKGLIYSGCLAVVGTLLPQVWLRKRAEARIKEIERALPNALDMLTVGVEAGLGFESAMLRVAEQWHNALTGELRRAVLEMRVGTPRDRALQHMADRTGVADIKTFAAVLTQASQLGISVADVLHTQAAQIRRKRRQRAETLARQASVKMAIPLVVFIFPALFVVILGPAVPRIMSLFS